MGVVIEMRAELSRMDLVVVGGGGAADVVAVAYMYLEVPYSEMA